MIRPASLLDLLDEYSLAKGLKASTRYQMGRAINLYSEWLHHPARLDDLTSESVNRWLAAALETHAQRTVAGHRTNLVVLWRDCAERGLCDPPNRVRRVPKPDPCPISWTADELSAIVERCKMIAGTFPTGAPRREYCLAVVYVAYDTGLRRSDVWTLPRSRVRPDGSIVMRQEKTGNTHTPRMRPAALKLFRSLPGDPPLRCPYKKESRWYRWWRENVIEPAGVRHGAMQQTRRTGATHLAIDHRESVQRYLGHRTPDMQRHYIDESIANPIQYLPPELG